MEVIELGSIRYLISEWRGLTTLHIIGSNHIKSFEVSNDGKSHLKEKVIYRCDDFGVHSKRFNVNLDYDRVLNKEQVIDMVMNLFDNCERNRYV